MSRTTFLREITLYRYRYILGYICFALLLFALLLLAIEQAPRGLTQAELDSSVASVNVNVFHPVTTNVVDAPYHLLQKTSIQIFGLTPTAIKLPSIILGAIMGVSIVLMLQKWFRKNVAIITAVIAVTSVGFLTLARTGTPMIMTAFWTVMLLLGATHVLHSSKYQFFWKLFCFACVALLAYSPFGIYPLLALAIAGIFHPHVRYRLKQGKWWQHVILISLVVIILAPLVIAIIFSSHIALTLLGLDRLDQFNWHTLPGVALGIGGDLFNFTRNTVGAIVTPLFGIATTVLLLLGILKLCTASYSARSYMLFIWGILLIPVLLLRPDMLLLVLIPSTLVLAIGIETLIRQWYDLFPRNPYARIAALIPLTILVFSIVAINMERYFYGHHYNPQVSEFHAELPAVRAVLHENKENVQTKGILVVPRDQVAFYDLLRREYPQLRIASAVESVPKTPTIVLDEATAAITVQPKGIVTSDLADGRYAVLLRTY